MNTHTKFLLHIAFLICPKLKSRFIFLIQRRDPLEKSRINKSLIKLKFCEFKYLALWNFQAEISQWMPPGSFGHDFGLKHKVFIHLLKLLFIIFSSCCGNFILCMLDSIPYSKARLRLFCPPSKWCWVNVPNHQWIPVFNIWNLLLRFLNYEPNFVQYDVIQIPSSI